MGVKAVAICDKKAVQVLFDVNMVRLILNQGRFMNNSLEKLSSLVDR